MGIDPGLVDTGIVTLEYDLSYQRRGIQLQYTTITMTHDDAGKPELEFAAERVVEWVARNEGWDNIDHVFVEKYVDRGTSYATNTGMRMFESVLRSAIATEWGKPPLLVDNTGSKKVIRPRLLKLLKLNDFKATHHQDLQAAARILIWGMLKDPELNAALVTFVRDHLNVATWHVQDLSA